VELIHLLELENFVSIPIKLTIHGSEEEDRPVWMEKKIQSVRLCPDGTHVRLYFDHHHFIAVPKESEIIRQKHEWSAYDEKSSLRYLIKKEGGGYHD